MSDTPGTTGAPQPSGEAPHSNSPFAQPLVPAPPGGDKSPVRRQEKTPPAQSAIDSLKKSPQERWRDNQPPAPPVITGAQRDALAAEGRWPLKPGDDGRPRDQQQHAQTQPDPASAEKVKVGDFEMTKADLADMVSQKAARDSIKATLPSPDAYRVELSSDFQAPEGVAFQLDTSDPAIPQLKEFAFENSLSQAAVSKLTDMYAGLKLKEHMTFENYKKAELVKLGTASHTRIESVLTWIKGTMGADADGLAVALQYAPSAKTVVAFEKLMHKMVSQDASSFYGNHRDTPNSGISDEQYDKMSFREKMSYAKTASQRAPSRR